MFKLSIFNSGNVDAVVKSAALACATFVFLQYGADFASAAGDVGAMFTRMNDSVVQTGAFIRNVFAVGGAFFLGTGAKNIYDSQKPGGGQVTPGTAAMKVAAGSCMLGVSAFSETIATTLFGSASSNDIGF
jgi:hypothetical protein